MITYSDEHPCNPHNIVVDPCECKDAYIGLHRCNGRCGDRRCNRQASARNSYNLKAFCTQHMHQDSVDLCRAAELGDIAAVNMLLERSTNPDYTIPSTHLYPLLYVVGNSRIELKVQVQIIRILISFGAQPNGPDKRLLSHILLEARGDVRRRHIWLETLLQLGADTEETDNDGYTLLMELCRPVAVDQRDEREKQIRTLLQFDVRVNAQDEKYGDSALAISAMSDTRVFDMILTDKRLHYNELNRVLLDICTTPDNLGIFLKLIGKHPNLMWEHPSTGRNVLMQLCNDVTETADIVQKVKILLNNLTPWQITRQNSIQDDMTAMMMAAGMGHFELVSLIETHLTHLQYDSAGHP